jgi:hypothetical protein
MKLGIKRGNDMLIASFKKADPSALPQMKRIVKVDGEPGEHGDQMRKELKIDGDPILLVEIGIIFAAKDGKIAIGDLMPMPAAEDLSLKPRVGDQLVTLQNASYTTADALQKAWDQIAVGDTVRLVLSRDGKETTSVFAKPKAMGEIKLKQSK